MTEASPIHTGPFILLADEDPGIHSAMERELRPLGTRVLHVTSVSAALGALAEGLRPSCLISELILPDTHAAALFEAALAADPPVPCILVTGYPFGHEPLHPDIASRLHAEFSKPWNFESLLESVHSALSIPNTPDGGMDEPHPIQDTAPRRTARRAIA